MIAKRCHVFWLVYGAYFAWVMPVWQPLCGQFLRPDSLHKQVFTPTLPPFWTAFDQCTSLNPSTSFPHRHTRGSWDGSIREVVRVTGKVRRTFYLGDLVMSMALSGEDRLLVAVGNSILCADLATRRGETEAPGDASAVDEDELCQLQLRHSCPITALTACPSGRFVFYGDGVLRRGA